MSMNTSNRIQPPRLKDGVKNIQQVAVTGSSQVVAVDPQLRNRWVRVYASVACAFYFRPDSAGSVDQALTTAQGSTSATLGYQMAAGTTQDFMLGGQDNFLVVQGTGAGILQLLGSGPLRITGLSGNGS
jgi:hypothetical protein